MPKPTASTGFSLAQSTALPTNLLNPEGISLTTASLGMLAGTSTSEVLLNDAFSSTTGACPPKVLRASAFLYAS